MKLNESLFELIEESNFDKVMRVLNSDDKLTESNNEPISPEYRTAATASGFERFFQDMRFEGFDPTNPDDLAWGASELWHVHGSDIDDVVHDSLLYQGWPEEKIKQYLDEDIKKTASSKWVNKGKEGTHGEFTTKKAAREQQKAMFAQGYKGEALDEATYQTKSISGNKMIFDVQDDGTFIVKDGDKVVLNTKVSDPQAVKAQIKDMQNVETLIEETNISETSESVPDQKDIGMANLLIDAINGEWDTIKLYNDIVANAKEFNYEDVSKVMSDIVDEETRHVGEIQQLLETISPNVASIEAGSDEADNLMNDKSITEVADTKEN